MSLKVPLLNEYTWMISRRLDELLWYSKKKRRSKNLKFDPLEWNGNYPIIQLMFSMVVKACSNHRYGSILGYNLINRTIIYAHDCTHYRHYYHILPQLWLSYTLLFFLMSALSFYFSTLITALVSNFKVLHNCSAFSSHYLSFHMIQHCFGWRIVVLIIDCLYDRKIIW